jgi:exopolyphosphatase/guanosine-5'-triphosphate,3'-diphosphate pyrophosphatase
MGERIAALDLGTNTFHLLIAEKRGEQAEIIFHEDKHPKLGEGGITKGLITDAAFERGLIALKEFAQEINRFEVRKVQAVGTAALREATNGAEFIQRVKEKTGIEIEIIDGDREAELIYQGVKNAVQLNSSSLIMDIGGGSVEFILCNKENIIWKKSYSIGAARLMALFHHSDPIDVQEIQNIRLFLNKQLPELKAIIEKHQPETLIGSAGAFETFSALEVKKFNISPHQLDKTEFTFNLEQFNRICAEILSSTHSKRAITPEIILVRVDMIVVATVLVQYILKEFRIQKMKRSAYALKEGLLFSQK